MIKTLVTYFFILAAGCALFAQEWSWKLYDKMPLPVAGAEVVTWDNKIYILGGNKTADGKPIDAIQQYDPAACLSERWSVVGSMHTPRANFVAKLYEHDSCIYIAGGAIDSKQEQVPAMEKWNLKTNTGTTMETTDVTLHRIGATGEIWRDYLIIIGGYTNATGINRPGYIAIYDLKNGRNFSPKIAPLANIVQYNHASITTGDSIYIFGGVRGSISNRIYNLNLSGSLTWPPQNIGTIIPRVHPDLSFPRSSLTAVKMMDESVWLVGGHSEDSTALYSTSKFIINRNGHNRGYEHQKMSSLLQARKEHVAAAVDSVIYVFGGLDENGKLVDTVEAFIDTVIENPGDGVSVNKQADFRSFQLKQNYPNPFNNSTTIEFELPRKAFVRLDIYTAQGQWIATMLNDEMNAGLHRVQWDGRATTGIFAPSGVYLYKMFTKDEIQTRKMLLVK